MHNSKITMLAYGLAVGFILAIALHPSKHMVTASEPVLMPVVDLK
jgi:hypothetical protein